MLLIFGGLGHDDDDHEHDNLTGVDSTPVNCGEDNLTPVDSTPVNCGEENASQKLLTTNEGGGGNQVCPSVRLSVRQSLSY